MVLLIDCGNTNTKFTTLIDNILTEIQSIDNNEMTRQWLDENLSKANTIVLASVANKSIVDFISCYCQKSNIKVEIISTQAQLNGVQCGYEEYQQLGVDRWLAVLGAAALFPEQNLIIIDAGTATTVDVLLASKQHLGGWILPGIEMLHQSIQEKTSNVKANFQTVDKLTFGKNTTDNVNIACWAATKGMIEIAKQQLVIEAQTQKITNEDITVLLTGGNASHLSKLLETSHQVVNDLVFHGMKATLAK